MELKTNIYLIGPMAAGKSTIGKVLARKLGVSFFDIDQEIIECTGVEIALIFELEGESGFRKRETDKIKRLSQLDNAVIATGGGAVLSKENQVILKNSGKIIYLQCSVNQQLSRTRFDTKRPLLQTENPRERLEQMMIERAPIYESLADITVSTERINSKRVINTIVEQLKRQP
ncbi:MAG: shikimate kinase AroK [Piscirickettsiaceae bacterium]|nr:MAG: shikimate kinase AroK [Piscirickettsiaceae bacterium]